MKYARQGFGLIAVVALIWLVFFSDGQGLILAWMEQNNVPVFWVVMGAAALYAILLAVPFFPAVELGWLVMAAFGTLGIVTIWAVTPLGLLLAFSLGYLMRDWPWVAGLKQLIQSAPGQPANTPLQRLLQRALNRLGDHPYWMLVVLINIPGNWVIGGGGGIGILAGASGLYRPLWYLLVLIPATGIVATAMLLGIEVRR